MTTTTGASAFDSTLAGLGIARTGQTAPKVTAKGATDTLGQSDFLKLMTAQMKNQDPFSPVDNTQMIAQMAQFSSVAGISSMNATLSGIATKLGATSGADAMSYVGKTVLTTGDTAYPRSSGGIAGAVELGGDASNLDINISDSNGNVVKSLSLGKQAKGSVTYDWDGTAANGTTPAGPFTVAISARNNGTTVPATGLVWAPVESISLVPGSDPTLNVAGLGTVKIADVRKAG